MYILKIYFMKNMYFLLESYLGLPANLKWINLPYHQTNQVFVVFLIYV